MAWLTLSFLRLLIVSITVAHIIIIAMTVLVLVTIVKGNIVALLAGVVLVKNITIAAQEHPPLLITAPETMSRKR